MFPEYVSVSQMQSLIAKFNVFRVWQPSAMTERACPQLKTEWRNFLPERGEEQKGEAFPCFHPLFPSGCVKSTCREEFQNHMTNVVQGFIKSYICFVNVCCYSGWNTFSESNPSQTMILIHGKHIEPRINRQEYADVIIFFFKLQTNRGRHFVNLQWK